MAKESEIKRAILDYLYMCPDMCVFPIATTGIFDPVQKRFRKSTMRLGTPDILICYQGRFVALEVKSEKGLPSPHQKEILKEIASCGGIAVIVKSVDDVATLFNELDKNLDKEI